MMIMPLMSTVDDGIATVVVTNPPVNALNDRVLEELHATAASLASREDIGAVVITGGGERTFIAGADLREFRDNLRDPAAMSEHVALTSRVFDAWAALPMPVVAAVGGHAMGGGLELALTADIIIADARVRLGTPEVTLGLMPGAGGTQRLGLRVPRTVATRMLLLGETLTAPEALAAGLVDRLAQPGETEAEARELAIGLAALPRLAIRNIKQALRTSQAAVLDHGLVAERALFLAVAAGPDAREGVDAFLEKRTPAFARKSEASQ
jgi:enoyl-CoA hydratase/carnithine racemase